MAVREQPTPAEAMAKLDHMQRYLVTEMVDDYKEGYLTRREMVGKVVRITGSVSMTATILLAMGCGPSTSATATTAPVAQAPTATATRPAALASPAASPTRVATPATPVASPRAASPAASPASPTRAGSPAATPNPVTVSPNDPAIEVATVQFPGRAGTVIGYRAQPRGVAKAIGLIVIHENRGLVEHIKDVARRYAKDGYLAVAVDLLSRQGGTDRVPSDQVQGALRDTNALAEDLVSSVEYLKGLPNFAGPKAGVVGYCMGGGFAWILATRSTDIGAAVPYYGPPPDPIDDVQKIVGPVLAFYGETDTFVNPSIPAIEAAMQRYGKTFEKVIYPGAGHAFNNDTGRSYNATAARDAYQRAKDWFTRYLRA